MLLVAMSALIHPVVRVRSACVMLCSAGGERVARDLFKEHFSSLGDAGPAPAPEGGSQCLRTQDLRQSLSAM